MNKKSKELETNKIKTAWEFLKKTSIQDIETEKWPEEIDWLYNILDDESTILKKDKEAKKEVVDYINKTFSNAEKISVLFKNAVFKDFLNFDIAQAINTIDEPVMLAFLINLGVNENQEKEIVEKISKSKIASKGVFEIGDDNTLVWTLLAKHGKKVDNIDATKIFWNENITITKVLEGFSNFLFFNHYTKVEPKMLIDRINDLLNRLISIENFPLIDVIIEIYMSFITHLGSKDAEEYAKHWTGLWLNLYDSKRYQKQKPLHNFNDINNHFIQTTEDEFTYQPIKGFKDIFRSFLNQKTVINEKGRDKILNKFNENLISLKIIKDAEKFEKLRGDHLSKLALDTLVTILKNKFPKIKETNIYSIISEITKEDLKTKEFNQEKQNLYYEMMLVWFGTLLDSKIKELDGYSFYTMYLINFISNKYKSN